jgi:hypothetical protein
MLDQLNHPSFRYLGQQTPNAIAHAWFHCVYDPWTNQTQLPELDQKAIETQPLPTNWFSNGLHNASTATAINNGLLRTLMFQCDGLECHGDPFGVPRIGLKRHFFGFRRFEMSIGVDLDPPRNRSKLSVWTQVQNGRIKELTGNIKESKGVRTPIHQRHHQRKIFLVKPQRSRKLILPGRDNGRQTIGFIPPSDRT